MLHVVDIAHPQYEDHISTVTKTLQDLGVVNKPTLVVFNKIDLYRAHYYDEMLTNHEKQEIENEFQENLTKKYQHESICISAADKENIDTLREKMTQMIKEQYVIRYPHQSQFW